MIRMLQDELHTINPFVQSYTNAGNIRKESNISNMQLIIRNTHGKDMRWYNQPTASEVAVIFDIDNNVPEPRDIIIETIEGKLKHINELNGAYDPLQYPLLFSYGEYGWHDCIFRANEHDPHQPEYQPEPEPRPEDPMDIEVEGEYEEEEEEGEGS